MELLGFIEYLVDFAHFAQTVTDMWSGGVSTFPPFGESRWRNLYPAYLDEKIWLSADSKITSSAHGAPATRPNGGREPRQIQLEMHRGMQKVQNPLNI